MDEIFFSYLDYFRYRYTSNAITRNKREGSGDVAMHKVQDIRIKGDRCFNHIIDLPQKNEVEKPLYDYEKKSTTERKKWNMT
jgi:hypothetical protein